MHNLVLSRKQTESAASGLLLATDVADYLVSQGMPFRDAHSVVGRLVRQLLAESREQRQCVYRSVKYLCAIPTSQSQSQSMYQVNISCS